jgi:hypothetical protein
MREGGYTIRDVDWFPRVIVHDHAAFLEVVAWNPEPTLHAFLQGSERLSLQWNKNELKKERKKNIESKGYRMNAKQKGVIPSHDHPFGVENLHHLYKLSCHHRIDVLFLVFFL